MAYFQNFFKKRNDSWWTVWSAASVVRTTKWDLMLIHLPILNLLVKYIYTHICKIRYSVFIIWLVQKLSPIKYLLDMLDYNLHNPKPAKICGWEENLFITVIILLYPSFQDNSFPKVACKQRKQLWMKIQYYTPFSFSFFLFLKRSFCWHTWGRPDEGWSK